MQSSLIARIAKTPKQEIATHTFSHYYCQEPGETREAFAADIASAIAIGRHYGFDIRSIVFPRNQFRSGLRSRSEGSRHHLLSRQRTELDVSPAPPRGRNLSRCAPRACSTATSRLSGPKFSAGKKSRSPAVCTMCAPACFCAPIRRSERVSSQSRLRRIAGGIRAAAKNRGIFHLWWHPHNFGKNSTKISNFSGVS